MTAFWLLGISSGLVLIGALQIRRRRRLTKDDWDPTIVDLLRKVLASPPPVVRAPGLRVSKIARFKQRMSKARG